MTDIEQALRETKTASIAGVTLTIAGPSPSGYHVVYFEWEGARRELPQYARTFDDAVAQALASPYCQAWFAESVAAGPVTDDERLALYGRWDPWDGNYTYHEPIRNETFPNCIDGVYLSIERLETGSWRVELQASQPRGMRAQLNAVRILRRCTREDAHAMAMRLLRVGRAFVAQPDPEGDGGKQGGSDQ